MSIFSTIIKNLKCAFFFAFVIFNLPLFLCRCQYFLLSLSKEISNERISMIKTITWPWKDMSSSSFSWASKGCHLLITFTIYILKVFTVLISEHWLVIQISSIKLSFYAKQRQKALSRHLCNSLRIVSPFHESLLLWFFSLFLYPRLFPSLSFVFRTASEQQGKEKMRWQKMGFAFKVWLYSGIKVFRGTMIRHKGYIPFKVFYNQP